MNIPLIAFIGKPSKYPKGLITPILSGSAELSEEWANSGRIDVPRGPMYQKEKLFNKICFGSDHESIYFHFDINQYNIKEDEDALNLNQIYIYMKNPKNIANLSPIRTVNKVDNLFSILKEFYSHEINISFYKNKILPIQVANAIEDGLWVTNLKNNVKSVYQDSLEISIPFDDLNVKPGEKIDFFFIKSTTGITEEIFPQDVLLTLKRPE